MLMIKQTHNMKYYTALNTVTDLFVLLRESIHDVSKKKKLQKMFLNCFKKITYLCVHQKTVSKTINHIVSSGCLGGIRELVQTKPMSTCLFIFIYFYTFFNMYSLFLLLSFTLLHFEIAHLKQL